MIAVIAGEDGEAFLLLRVRKRELHVGNCRQKASEVTQLVELAHRDDLR